MIDHFDTRNLGQQAGNAEGYIVFDHCVISRPEIPLHPSSTRASMLTNPAAEHLWVEPRSYNGPTCASSLVYTAGYSYGEAPDHRFSSATYIPE
ncbi:hypothetical protein BDV18DRAFT_139869 [Aspergillus unguis]